MLEFLRSRIFCLLAASLLGALVVAAGLLLPKGTGSTSALANSTCSPIALENQNPGTDSWILTNPADDVAHQIKGYASQTSVNIGDELAFHVSVWPAQNYAIDIYRMGWYQGLGGRLMHQSPTQSGTVQPSLVISPSLGLIEAPWSADYALTISANWVSGVYLAKLTNANGFENYIPFVVRDDARTADLLYQRPDFTDQAYNNYPDDGEIGKSLYAYNSYGGNTVAGDKRAVKVSFDRPYSGHGAGNFFEWEFNLIRWLEKSGYDVAYSSNMDTYTHSANLLNYVGFLSPAHDEYWSMEMRTGVDAARDSGVNLAFLGANSAYWQIRMEDSTEEAATASGSPVQPNRTLVSYKNWNLDPITTNSLKTYLWRTIWRNGGYHAEQRLMGIQYDSYGASNANTDYVVLNSDHWLYANTGFADNDTVADIVGYEVDRAFDNFDLPNNQHYTILSASPYINTYGDTVIANSVIYQALDLSTGDDGAWVFASGTMSWSWALDKPGYVDARIQKTTANLLNAFVGGAPAPCFPEPTPTPTDIPMTVQLPPTPTPTTIPVAGPINGFAQTAYIAGEYASAQSDAELATLIDIGANWVSLLPTWYQTDIDATEIFYDYTITPIDSDLIHAIDKAHSLGLKVLLKPHIDLQNDPSHWRGQIGTNFGPSDWQQWFASYQTFINHYAELAESHNVEMFSVGTELVATTHQTADWRNIVQGVRSRYRGPLTYAANHSGEDTQAAFWDDLDVIGIDAYYPLSNENNPTLAEMEASWAPRETFLAGLHSTYQKPILFTEIGYTSGDGANKNPFCEGCVSWPDLQEQADAYQAVFNVFGGKPWFLGTVWWEWETDAVSGSPCDTRFTPFGKPAENVIRSAFGVAPRSEISNPCSPANRPELFSPAGPTEDVNPSFTWEKLDDAPLYQLVIYDVVSETIIYAKTFASNAVCESHDCTVQTIDANLSTGSYRWLVQPYNSYGSGRWGVE